MVAKWLLFAVVLFAVAYRGWTLWHDVDAQAVKLRADWLAAAVVVYILGWLPAMVYWRTLLAAVGDRLPLKSVARAYYCGHLGKYLPGKAGVIVIRAAMIGACGGRVGRAAITAGYETLTTIATGTAVAAMFAPWVFYKLVHRPGWEWLAKTPAYPYSIPIFVGGVYLLLVPLTARIFSRALKIRKSVRKKDEDSAEEIPTGAISSGLLLRGSLLLIVGWCVHGLALGCIIRGTGDVAFDLADWPLWTAAVAAAISGGFLALFAPGGIGVREWLLAEALQSQIGPQQAVAVAVLFRLVSLLGEATAAGVLWRFGRPKPE